MKIGSVISTAVQSLKLTSSPSYNPPNKPASGNLQPPHLPARPFWVSASGSLLKFPWPRSATVVPGQFQLSSWLKPQRVPALPVKSAGGSHFLTSAP